MQKQRLVIELAERLDTEEFERLCSYLEGAEGIREKYSTINEEPVTPKSQTGITEEALLKAGFEKKYNDEMGWDFFMKDGIDVWEVKNDDGWIIDMLDDVCIDKKFRYMEELELYFTACGLELK